MLGPDSILDPIPGVGSATIKGKRGNIIILKDRDDDDIGKHCWAMPQCLQMCMATNTSNAPFPSMHTSHKRGHKHIYHLPKIFNYFLFI